MRRRSFVAVAIVAVAGVAGCRGDDASADASAKGAAESGAPGPRTVESDRTANDAAYREKYLPHRVALAASRRGQWIAIVDGRVLPSDSAGPAPAARIEDVDALARAAAPEARHRYVFPVGDDGDVEWPMGGCELKHVVGVGFLGLLERDDVEMRSLGPGRPVRALFGTELREITVKGPDARMYLRPEVGPPLAGGRASEIYCISTGFGGVATMSPATAAAARLELWEIPGTADVYHGAANGRCRRALARFSWPGSALDATIPVAVWPE